MIASTGMKGSGAGRPNEQVTALLTSETGFFLILLYLFET